MEFQWPAIEIHCQQAPKKVAILTLTHSQESEYGSRLGILSCHL